MVKIHFLDPPKKWIDSLSQFLLFNLRWLINSNSWSVPTKGPLLTTIRPLRPPSLSVSCWSGTAVSNPQGLPQGGDWCAAANCSASRLIRVFSARDYEVRGSAAPMWRVVLLVRRHQPSSTGPKVMVSIAEINGSWPAWFRSFNPLTTCPTISYYGNGLIKLH